MNFERGNIMSTKDEKHATQEFEIRNILTGYCGQTLTPNKVDELAEDVKNAMREGPCSWAFD